MHLIIQYLKDFVRRVIASMTLKTLGTIGELMIPYILEHIIDSVVPQGNFKLVIMWGIGMIAAAIIVRYMNVISNRMAVDVARDSIRNVRHELFRKTMYLSGTEFDEFGLPSLTSRMTSDSYNVQNFFVQLQTMGMRAPMMLIGGIIVTMTMDPVLSLVLCIMIPILGVAVFIITRYGIPLYDKVQRSLDTVVRIMRENITGIRVVKALSKEEYEKNRYQKANDKLTHDDIRANVIMALPSPLMQLFLYVGLALVVIIGAHRVNNGIIQPGVILAFLTYFNMVLQGVMGLNRIFMMASKAIASANRIDLVLQTEMDQPRLPLEGHTIDTDSHIVFDHVTFGYHEADEKCLYDISFSIGKGESLGIIGATGSGKTSIINLLMRFYDTDEGGIYINGKDVRTYAREELRTMFGVAFQNDTIFHETLRENISFGRNLDDEAVRKAAHSANIDDFIEALDEGYEYMADIKGMNLSGGQKQRMLVARAVAGSPDILILDDSSSALDYKTDAALRKAIQTDYADSTLIMIAQRVSSIMSLKHILVLDEGKMIGYGTHEELLKTCPVYQEIYQSQMGDIA